jgi:thiol-disulfide isomerase/thioredoxin
MRNFLASLVFILCIFPCWSQHKRVDIYFPDSTGEKEVTLHYSIKGILNYFYEPYMNMNRAWDNKLSFDIPDSISTFLLVIPSSIPYNWSKNIVLYMNSGEKLDIYLDSINPPRFVGDNVDLQQFMYSLKIGTGSERANQTLKSYMNDETTASFFDFIHKNIETNIVILDNLLKNKNINEKSYVFAKNQVIDDYLFRAGMIGSMTNKEYLSKIDSINFYSDLDKLFKQYNETYDWGISLDRKAALKAMELIPGQKLELGLDSIYSIISYLNRDEQEEKAASEIITNVSVGQLDSIQLDRQRMKYKEVFPNSVYLPILNELKHLNKKDYILSAYSIENGYQEYGQFKTDNLDKITGMFLGGKPVFIDFWATWCAPCIKEFNYRKELEVFLEENNIGLLFVSLDYAGAYDKWKQLIQEKQLEGLHYLGTQELVNQLPYFKENRFIPRYVLLDKDGSVLVENGELPSSGKLIPQIKEKLGL